MNAVKINIKSKRKVAEGTTEITFTRPSNFEFIAGQHVQIALNSLNYPDPIGLSCVFSICSSPFNKDIIAITFRDTGSGYKKTISELPEGSEVMLEGPFGFFTLPDSEKPHIFIAGGIGITPFLSMIESSLKKEKPSPITLLYANKNKESSAYLEYLKELSETSKHFSLDAIFGRIGVDDIQRHVKDTINTSWWIVGPPRMVAEVKHLLVSFNIPDAKIRTE